jgi:hypothetical protein
MPGPPGAFEALATLSLDEGCSGLVDAAIPDYRPDRLIGGKKAAGHRCPNFSGNAVNCKHKRSFSVNRRWRRGRYYPTGAFVLK